MYDVVSPVLRRTCLHPTAPDFDGLTIVWLVGLCVYPVRVSCRAFLNLQPEEHWQNWPLQNVDAEVKSFYMLQLGVYFNMLVSQFVDVRRKDFLAMFVRTICWCLCV
jgi:hypothetical protein